MQGILTSKGKTSASCASAPYYQLFSLQLFSTSSIAEFCNLLVFPINCVALFADIAAATGRGREGQRLLAIQAGSQSQWSGRWFQGRLSSALSAAIKCLIPEHATPVLLRACWQSYCCKHADTDLKCLYPCHAPVCIYLRLRSSRACPVVVSCICSIPYNVLLM